MIEKISLLVPFHNEESNVEFVYEQLSKYAQDKFTDYELIFVDDGSSDKTKDILKGLERKDCKIVLVIHEQNRGYGAALRTGFAKAKFNHLCFMDGDRQFDINDLSLLLSYAEDNKIISGVREERSDSLGRLFSGFLFKCFAYVVIGKWFSDVNCGLKLISSDLFLDPSLTSNSGMLNVQLYKLAVKREFNVKEVPVQHFSRQYGLASGGSFSFIFSSLCEWIGICLKK